MSNILTVEKLITNHKKISETFRKDSICGPTFDFAYTKGSTIRIYFTESMTQAIADQGTYLINNHVDTDILGEATNITRRKQDAGFQLYQKIISDINLSGGLPGYLDDNQIPAYESHLRILRDMLKDGFPEFALRKFATDIGPLGLFTAEKSEEYCNWIGDLAIEYGADEALVGALKAVPKGNYPFGAIGAP